MKSTYPYHPTRSQTAHLGLTLIELLISIAVSAIIVTITFSGLRTEQQRTATKDATDRLQVELLGLQNKMQAGVAIVTNYCTRGGGDYVLQGKQCTVAADCLANAGNPNAVQGRCINGPPGSYGLSILAAGTNYNIFADMPNGATPLNGIYDTSNTNDLLLSGNKSLGQNIQVARLTSFSSTGTSFNAARLDITFSGTNGQVIVYGTGCLANCASGKIILKQTVTGVCYSITVDKASQIVSKRQFSPTCT